MDRLAMFGMNIYLLIGLVMFAVMVCVFIFVFWTGIKVYLFHRKQKNNPYNKGDWTTKPKPSPTAPGICDKCGRVMGDIHHLPEGRRLCSVCLKTASAA